jgi:hypothetical protein
MFMTAGTETSTITKVLEEAKSDVEKKLIGDIDELIQEISNKTFEQAMNILSEFVEKHPEIGIKPAALLPLIPFDEKDVYGLLSKGITVWEKRYPQISQILNNLTAGIEAHMKQGDKTLAKARTTLEEYFDQAMDRLIGVYRRRSQLVGLGIGILTVFLFNADAIMIGTTLWREPIIRTALTAKAQEVFKAPDIEAKKPEDAWSDFQNQFDGLDIPLGWNTQGSGSLPVPIDMPLDGVTWDWWASKVLGWGISGAAAAQGAPFWFDILKKVVNLRTSGTNPTEKEKKVK